MKYHKNTNYRGEKIPIISGCFSCDSLVCNIILLKHNTNFCECGKRKTFLKKGYSEYCLDCGRKRIQYRIQCRKRIWWHHDYEHHANYGYKEFENPTKKEINILKKLRDSKIPNIINGIFDSK